MSFPALANRTWWFLPVISFASACTWGEPAIRVTVELDPNAAGTQCVLVVAQAPGIQDKATPPITRDTGRGSLEVGVYQGALPGNISLVARGFDDSSCTSLNEETAPLPAAFARWQVPHVTLHLQGPSCASCPSTECSTITCLPDGGCSTPTILTGQPCDGGTCQPDGACSAAATSISAFPYVPSNFDPDAIADAGVAGPTILACDAWFDSTDGGMSWCSGQPVPAVYAVAQSGGPEAVVLAMSSLNLSGTLSLFGTRPVILAVFGDATVAGTLSARSATGQDAGAGADSSGLCTAGAGDLLGVVGSGGGGGGFGETGGRGGDVTLGGSSGGVGGPSTGNATIVPLRGGCSGAAGGRPNDGFATGGVGGGGGGAMQLSAAGRLSISGTVTAGGAGGKGGLVDQSGYASQGGNGGGGGGSGGALLLEAWDVRIASAARLTAGGGGGGEGGDGLLATGTNGNPGFDAPTTATSGGPGGAGAAPCAGDGGTGGSAEGGAQNGGDVLYAVGGCAGGGGGGGAGRTRINAGRSCRVDAGVMSPGPTFGGTCP